MKQSADNKNDRPKVITQKAASRASMAFVAMKNFIKGNEEKKSTEFDPEKYNKDIMKKLEKMI